MIKEPGDDVPDEILEEILGCDFSQVSPFPASFFLHFFPHFLPVHL